MNQKLINLVAGLVIALGISVTGAAMAAQQQAAVTPQNTCSGGGGSCSCTGSCTADQYGCSCL